MCGIISLALGDRAEAAASDILEGLWQLQHRGQDACGIVVAHPGHPAVAVKGNGLLSDVFTSHVKPESLSGHLGVGHVRYRTSGLMLDSDDIQPLSSRGTHEIHLAHNGHVTFDRNAEISHKQQLPPLSDSHAILSILSEAMEAADSSLLDDQVGLTRLALSQVYERCHGSFACTAMIDSSVLVGFRDAHGIKPLVLGRRRGRQSGCDYMLASESVVLEKLDFELVADIKPGQAVIISSSGKATESLTVEFLQVVPPQAYSPDIFEYVYFARPESTIDGINVHECRRAMGAALAKNTVARLGRETCRRIDVVIPVPDSGYLSAQSLAYHLNVPLGMGLVRNKYLHRTFILPTKARRRKAIWRKLTAVRSEFAGKNVLVMDDSIVRGSTSREIVKMARAAGAAKVFFASASPAIRFNHIYGIDLADPKALVAYGRSDDEVATVLGADAVIYLPLDDLVRSCLATRTTMHEVYRFEVGIFTGQYVTRPDSAALVFGAATSRRPGHDEISREKRGPEQSIPVMTEV